MASKDRREKARDKWLGRIADETKAHEAWRKRAEDAEKAYCNYDGGATAPNYPVFYTTVNLIQGKINGRPPKPDVRKRHPSSPQSQQQPQATGGVPPQLVGMAGQPQAGAPGQPPPSAPAPPVASQISDDNIISMTLERALSYTIDTTAFQQDANQAVKDYLVAGLGQCKVEMETQTDTTPVIVPMPDPMTGQIKMLPTLDPETGKPMMLETITSQVLHLRHFHHTKFRWEPAKDWRQVKWVAFDHNMTRDDIEDQFGIEIKEGDSGPSNGNNNNNTNTNAKPPQRDKYEATYIVHEIWDKRKKMRLFVSDCHNEILDEEDDPLELENFYPCPAPMMANVNGVELVPCPDYWQYQYLVNQCSVLSERIKKITEQVKDIKFYDDSFGASLKQADQYPDGTFVAVKQLLDKLRSQTGKADTSAIICELDMTNKVAVLKTLSAMLDEFKSRIYEINGIDDVQRGVSNPNETATAQTIKNDWADIRTGQRVQTVALFDRDVFRIMSEIIASKFDKPQIEAMTGIALSDDQLGIMRSDLATAYNIDVESDSTMTVNDSQNVAELMQFMQALEPLLQSILPGMQSGAMPAGLGKELFNLVVDTYKPGRDLQQEVESLPSTLQQLSQLGQRAQQAEQGMQQAQQQLQQYQQGEEQRKNAQVQADTQDKAAQTQKTVVETQLMSPPDARKKAADATLAEVQAAQAARQNLMEGQITGIQ